MTRKITQFVVILVVFGFMLAAYTYAEEDGFRGLKWGTQFSIIKEEMDYVRTDPSYGGTKIYSRKNDKLQIGKAEVQSIGYSFWQEKLSSVMIRFQDYSNFVSLKDIIFQRFGPGHTAKSFLKGYVWRGKMTNMSLEYEEVLKEGYWFLYSIEIYKEQKRFLAEKAKKGGKTDF